MKRIAFLLVVLTVSAAAQQAPAPTVSKKLLALAAVSTASAFADSYTTQFAAQNWAAGKQGVCNVEVESAWLYGRHPNAARSYGVAAGKSAAAFAAAYYLKKHHHSKLWALPLLANTGSSLQGVAQNMRACN